MKMYNKLTKRMHFAQVSILFFGLILSGIAQVSAKEQIENQQKAYNVQLKKYNQAKNQLESIRSEIRASEAKIKNLETDKNNAAEALQDIQRIDRENPNLGLSKKVEEARDKNREAFSAYDKEVVHLKELQIKAIAADKQVKDEIITLNSIARNIKQAHDQIVADEVEKRISNFKKTTIVEGYAEVGCGEESPRKCQSRAKRAAERDASEKGSIVVVQAATSIENFQMTQDEVKTEVQAQLSNVEVLEKGWIGDTTYVYSIRASVTPIIGASLRQQVEESIAQELGINVPEELPYSNIGIESTMAASAAEQSFDEMDRDTSHTKTDIEREEEAQRKKFAEKKSKSKAKKSKRPPVVRPEGEIESWYTLWSFGFSSNSYYDDLDNALKDLEDAGADRSTIALDVFGFYWPVNQSTLAGFIISGTSDSLEGDNNSEVSISQSLWAFSSLNFLGKTIGNGFYVRGDVGLARYSAEVKGAGVTLAEESDSGLGLLGGIGYSLPVSSESRILFSLGLGVNFLDDETFTSARFNIGGLW